LTLFVRKYLLLFLKIKFLIPSFKKKVIVFNELNQIKESVAKIAIFNTSLYEIKCANIYIFSVLQNGEKVVALKNSILIQVSAMNCVFDAVLSEAGPQGVRREVLGDFGVVRAADGS